MNKKTTHTEMKTLNQAMAGSATLLPLCILFSFLPLNAFAGTGGFTVDLIHRDSPSSPLYNPSLSSSDRLRSAAHRSVSRAKHLSTLYATSSNSSFQSEVIPNSYEYLMTLHVGTPPFKILAIADTGSDLTWTQCKPCVHCYDQKAPLFDPSKSSTYRTVSCDSDYCSQLPVGGCGDHSLCQYHYTYGDQSYTLGDLSSDTFTFQSSTSPDTPSKVAIPKIKFGCSHQSNGTFDENGAGLVGLGAGPLSLVSQLGSSIDNRFSYCLVPYAKGRNSTSQLNFGDRASVGGEAVTTPLLSGDVDTFYYLSLEEISVGDKKVVSSRSSNTRGFGDGGEGNIIIDSGTTLTVLDDSMLQPVVDELTSSVNLPTVRDGAGLFELCFDVSGVSEEDVQLPEITFHFKGDAAVKLGPMHTFVQTDEGSVCLVMVSARSIGGGGLAILGNLMQQNFHIGYDLGKKELSIAPADCAKF